MFTFFYYKIAMHNVDAHFSRLISVKGGGIGQLVYSERALFVPKVQVPHPTKFENLVA